MHYRGTAVLQQHEEGVFYRGGLQLFEDKGHVFGTFYLLLAGEVKLPGLFIDALHTARLAGLQLAQTQRGRVESLHGVLLLFVLLLGSFTLGFTLGFHLLVVTLGFQEVDVRRQGIHLRPQGGALVRGIAAVQPAARHIAIHTVGIVQTGVALLQLLGIGQLGIVIFLLVTAVVFVGVEVAVIGTALTDTA